MVEQAPFRVIVVDDDFMVAKVHSKLVNAQEGFEVIGQTYNYEQTLIKVRDLHPDLLVLDVYMPDRSGIELLRTIRSENSACDVILITAAKEIDVVEEGFRLGIFDYLIKPFDLDHLEHTLVKYCQFRSRLTRARSLDQKIVDDLKRIRSTGISSDLQTGVDFRTLERIRGSLFQAGNFESADRIALLSGVSRSTARMYLAYLVSKNMAEEKLVYGKVGRPQKLYRIKT